ncbi:CBF/Mak21 family-domain-containing protein [Phlyctochytrium arcticum]|nr:CBF/Mak21 family-domain-containing protein [Phlyctochytrium arcticum]
MGAQTLKDPSKDMILQPASQWHKVALPPLTAIPAEPAPEEFILVHYEQAKNLWEQDVLAYEKTKATMSADQEFISTVLKSGTVTDKISAVTLLIQESPVHTLGLLRDHLVHGMARKKSRREAVMAIDSVKDLLMGTLLPDRKLRYFRDQPLRAKNVSPQHLVQWYFEDGLKKVYFDFIKLVEELARDPLPHVKNKMVQYISDLLSSKPEQEQNLLALLVNKLGDQERKLASNASHLLSKLLLQHPAMKLIVIKEVERLLFRVNISDRARYYAITFLNQIVLSHKGSDVAAANKLIEVYFAVFDGLGKRKEDVNAKEELKKEKNRWRDGKKGKGGGKGAAGKGKGGKGKGKGNGKAGPPSNGKGLPAIPTGDEVMVEVNGIDAKMMAALLTGVNRAFPYAAIDDAVFDEHMKTLFMISHIGSFNTAIQALTLIFQVQLSRQSVSDRFYRVLYETLFDSRLFTASKQAMYLNLLYRAIKADVSLKRVKAFVKRIAQICAYAQVPFLCASLFLIGEIFKARPGVSSMVSTPEESLEDGEEKFVDAVEEDDEEIKEPSTVATAEVVEAAKPEPVALKSAQYDGRKREPLYANADASCLWELSAFSKHFHPTVAMYAETLLSGQPIAPPPGATNYDPLQNHTLSRFLDRFVFKNPKKVTNAYKGASLMQPRVGSKTSTREEGQERIISAAKKRGMILESEETGGKTALDDTPVNQLAQKWIDKGVSTDVPVDEMFFYNFFKSKQAQDNKARKRKTKTVDEQLDAQNDVAEDDEEEMDEDDVWAAMQRSAGFDPAVAGAEEEDDSGDDSELDAALAGEDFSDDDDDNEADDAFSEPESGSDGVENMEDAFAAMDGFGAGGDQEGEDDDMANWVGGDDGDDIASDDDLDNGPDNIIEGGDGEFAKFITAEEEGDLSDDVEDDDADDKKKPKKKRAKKRDILIEKARALGYKGEYFTQDTGGLGFADADDFMALIEREDDEEGEGETAGGARHQNKSFVKRKRGGPTDGPRASQQKAKRSKKTRRT